MADTPRIRGSIAPITSTSPTPVDTATTRSASSRNGARRIALWRRRADVLVYFNNDWEGFAVDNARSLSRRFRTSRG
jgi:hypothetical protein